MPRLSVYALRMALLYFLLGISMGALLLANKAMPVSGAIWAMLPIHIEFLLFGWMVQFVFGVGFWIFPRFTAHPRHGRSSLAWASLGLLNTGLLLVVAGALTGQASANLLGRAAENGSAVLFVIYAWGRIRPTATGANRAIEAP